MVAFARSALAGVLLLAGCATHEKPVSVVEQPMQFQLRYIHSRHHKGASTATAKHHTSRDLVMEAQHELLRGTPDRMARAVALYRQAAARGNALAEYNLGYCNEAGLGVPANAREASSWYRRAAANGKDPAVRRIAADRLAALVQPGSNKTPQASLIKQVP